MTRNSKKLTVLPDGAPRRLSDGRNAFRKMSPDQQAIFLSWIVVECDETSDKAIAVIVRCKGGAR